MYSSSDETAEFIVLNLLWYWQIYPARLQFWVCLVSVGKHYTIRHKHWRGLQSFQFDI